MTDVTGVSGFIDPINGNDATGQPDDPEFPYKTIDGFYSTQSPSTSGVLTAKVQTGNVFLGLKEYINLQVVDVSGSPSSGALLSIFGAKNSTIHLQAFFLQIDTEITLEADPNDGTMDIPVFLVDEAFGFGPGYSLNQIEKNADFTNPNRARDIFNFEGLVAPVDEPVIDQTGSQIVMNRVGAILFGGIMLRANTFMMQEKFPTSNFFQASENTIFTSISVDEFCTRIYHEFPTGALIAPDPPRSSCNTVGEAVVLSAVVTLTGGLAIIFATLQGKNLIKDITKPICKTTIFRASSNPRVAAKSLEVQQRLAQGLPIVTATGGFVTSSGSGTAVFTDIEGIQVNNINFQEVIPFLDAATEQSALFNLQQNFNTQFNSGSIFRLPHLITSNYTHTQFDGEVFPIDASRNDVTVTIPIGDVSNNRIFEYVLLSPSSHRVTITSPGRINGLKQIHLSNNECKISSIRLFGYNNHILVLSHSSSLNPTRCH